MPLITNPVFKGGRIRELNTEEGWLKYIPAGGSGLETYQISPDLGIYWDDTIQKVKMFLLGYATAKELKGNIPEEVYSIIVDGKSVS